MLPKGWRRSHLRDVIGGIETGTSVNSEDRRAGPGEIAVLKTSAAFGGRFLADKHKVVVDADHHRVACPVRANTILLSRMNTKALVGESGYVPTDRPDLFLPDRLWALSAARGCDAKWLAQLLASPAMREHLGQRATGTSGSMKNISQDGLLGIPVTIPPLPEQRRIAAVLDAWDAAIATAERLVEAKRRHWASLADNLLSPGFLADPPAGWRAVRLEDVFTEREERGGDGKLLSITAMRGVIDREEVDRKDTSAADKSNYKRIRAGDIGYNTMRMWQGVSALSALEGFISPAYTVVIPKPGLDGAYAAHLFKTPHMINLFWRYSQGLVDDTLSIKFPEFSLIRIGLPMLDQQRQIAATLDAVASNLKRTVEFKDRLELQKRGLMQQLLTGRLRVPESIDALLPSPPALDEAA